ncbi:MAG TPA: TetR family transcriptional regulator [Anaerolineae bacterium]|nr:TetR family transcriptional regulator [Anaerolineae bacterium]
MSKVEAKKEQIVMAITQYLIMEGLGDVGLRQLAAVAGTSDRMLIYYFETKDGLLEQVLEGVAANLAEQLDGVLGEHQREGGVLVAELLALGDSEPFQSVVRLWFEVVGLAVRGQAPYAAIASLIADNWLGWMRGRLVADDVGEAERLFAQVEGTLMLRLIGVSV